MNPGIGVQLVPNFVDPQNRGKKKNKTEEKEKHRRKYPGIGVTLVPKLVIGRLNTHMVMEKWHPGGQPITMCVCR